MAMIARPTRFRRESISALKNTIAAGIPNSKARNSNFIRFIVISYAQRQRSGDGALCATYPATHCSVRFSFFECIAKNHSMLRPGYFQGGAF